jgi:hypothetical protein
MVELDLKDFDEKLENAKHYFRRVAPNHDVDSSTYFAMQNIIQSIELLAIAVKQHYHYEENE